MEEFIVIAMDGDGNVDFRDGQRFASESVAKRVAADMNADAEKLGSDWYYMSSPSFDD